MGASFFGGAEMILAGKVGVVLGDHARQFMSVTVAGSNTALTGGFSVTDGAGNDMLNIGQGTQTDMGRFFAKLSVDGGDDADITNDIQANNFFASGATVTATNV